MPSLVSDHRAFMHKDKKHWLMTICISRLHAATASSHKLIGKILTIHSTSVSESRSHEFKQRHRTQPNNSFNHSTQNTNDCCVITYTAKCFNYLHRPLKPVMYTKTGTLRWFSLPTCTIIISRHYIRSIGLDVLQPQRSSVVLCYNTMLPKIKFWL